jgi:hypothetical protein
MCNNEDKKEHNLEEHDSSADFSNVIKLKAKLSGSSYRENFSQLDISWD